MPGEVKAALVYRLFSFLRYRTGLRQHSKHALTRPLERAVATTHACLCCSSRQNAAHHGRLSPSLLHPHSLSLPHTYNSLSLSPHAMGDRPRNVSKVPLGSTPPTSGPSQDLSSTLINAIVPEQRTTAEHDELVSSQRLGEPADTDPRRSLASESSLPAILLSPSMDGGAEFTGRARIRIHLADTRPPVFVWTSLNSWQAPLQMVADSPDSQIYCCEVDNVPDQPFQYKVRVGDRWILDDDMPVGECSHPMVFTGYDPKAEQGVAGILVAACDRTRIVTAS